MPRVVKDAKGNTAIEIKRGGGMVEFIPLVNKGFEVLSDVALDFDDRWKTQDFPIDRAAKLYVEYAQIIGATKEAMTALGKIVPITYAQAETPLAKMLIEAAPPPKPKKAALPAFTFPHASKKVPTAPPIVEPSKVWDAPVIDKKAAALAALARLKAKR